MERYQELEHRWAEFNELDPKSMVACSSGTAALHLALEALRLPLGSSVLLPDYTMIACPRAVTLAGLTPIFIDCRSDSLLIDNSEVAAALSAEREPVYTVKAIMLVHIYGRRCSMSAVMDLASKKGLYVIEDMSEIHGVKPHKDSHAACWSFYKNKVVAGEEGGAVWFKDESVANLARLLRCQGFTPAHDYVHVPRGHNYRMANLLAEPILKSLEYVHSSIYRREEIVEWYEEACPPEWRAIKRDIPWVYDIRVQGITARQQGAAVRSVQKAGIGARHGFKPCSSQKEYLSAPRYGDWQRAQAAEREVMYLPIQPGLTTKESAALAFELLESALRVERSVL